MSDAAQEKLVYISFHSPVNEKTAQSLLAITFDQINKGATHLYYLLSTPGGNVSSGITLYNILKGLPVEITMHNAGNIDSIGNAIFLAGKNRYACPHSTFMFHGVGFDVHQQRFERKNLEEFLGSLKADEDRIGRIIVNETSLVSEDVDRFFVNASTKDANFAKESGIIHDVAPINVPKGVAIFQLVS